MKAVWRTLKRTSVITEEIPFPTSVIKETGEEITISLKRPVPPTTQVAALDPLERLKTWGVSDRDVSPQDQACAALFAFTVFEFSQPRSVGTRSDAEALAAPLFSAAKTCRWIANEAPSPSPEEKGALEVAAAYIEKWVGWQLNHLLNSPYTIGKKSSGTRGDDKVRARVRALATATNRIFGKSLYGTVAIITTVALEITPAIGKQSVINWCSEQGCQLGGA
jgi:hypothetical protein